MARKSGRQREQLDDAYNLGRNLVVSYGVRTRRRRRRRHGRARGLDERQRGAFLSSASQLTFHTRTPTPTNGTYQIVWYENDGSGGGWTKNTITSSASDAYAVFAIDLDGDGDMDVLSASRNDDTVRFSESKT